MKNGVILDDNDIHRAIVEFVRRERGLSLSNVDVNYSRKNGVNRLNIVVSD